MPNARQGFDQLRLREEAVPAAAKCGRQAATTTRLRIVQVTASVIEWRLGGGRPSSELQARQFNGNFESPSDCGPA